MSAPARVGLTDPLEAVVGKSAATTLAEQLGLHTVEDLLRHYPRSYREKGADHSAESLVEGEYATVTATVVKADLVPIRSRPHQYLLKATLDTGGGRTLTATFFNGQRLKSMLAPGSFGLFSGSVKRFRNALELSHPAMFLMPAEGTHARASGAFTGLDKLAGMTPEQMQRILDLPVLPIYPATAKIASWTILGLVLTVFDRLDAVADPLPTDLREQAGMLTLEQALHTVHLPGTRAEVALAHERLRFDEALALQLVLAQRRYATAHRQAPECPPRPDGIAAAFDARLPFSLTEGQAAVGDTLRDELARSVPMSRLLQGEVGSGKTIVALRAMLQVVDAGHQCALLAPTEVLATQHFRSISAQLGDLAEAGRLGAAAEATKVVLLTGSMPTAARRSALLDIVSGEAGIVIGTHALIQDAVEFFDLGLAVVDEQHRFGVEQRDQLRTRGRGGLVPHLLVMTATPIPRTIAMTLLGDLDASTLRELPAGRSPIASSVVPTGEKPAWLERAWQRIREEVQAGRQAYVVCSRIGDGEADDAAPDLPIQPIAAVDLYDRLATDTLSDLRVGLLHGRLPAEEKDETMSAFAAGEIDVLVATTVVEVGVDVPNATVMVICDAERFGVSQLHQLRGRVGRGSQPGLCILLTQWPSSAPSFERLRQVAATNDGFELAQLDLLTRREGDVLGVAQSGTISSLRFLSLIDHEDVLLATAEHAARIVGADPSLAEHPGLASMVAAALDASRTDYLEKT